MAELQGTVPFRRARTRAADQVTEDVRLQILSGAVPRGTRLPSEKELAVRYDVSAPTVREALRALSAMSLIEVRHGTGAFVIADTARLLASAMEAVVRLEGVDILGILDISEALFVKAVRLGVLAAEETDLEALAVAAGRLASGPAGADFAAALDAFLKALVALSHNPLLIGLSGFLIDTQIALAQESGRRSPAVWQRIAGELDDERMVLVAALRARDTQAAEQALLVYLQRGRDLVRLNEANSRVGG